MILFHVQSVALHIIGVNNIKHVFLDAKKVIIILLQVIVAFLANLVAQNVINQIIVLLVFQDFNYNNKVV